MKKISLSTLIAVAGFTFVSVAPVLAENSSSMTVARQKIETEHQQQAANREQKAKDAFSKLEDRPVVLANCAVVEGKVKVRLSNDDKLQAKHDERYAEVVTKVTDLITKAKTDGYDTTALEADLVNLQAQVDQFKTDKDTYIAALQTSQSYVCGKSEGQFKDAIVGARADLATIAGDVKDIHDYVVGTIQPAVRALTKAATTH